GASLLLAFTSGGRQDGANSGGRHMPSAPYEGARIYYEETGRGTSILFIHGFGGDHRSWEDQMRHFGRSWRGITWGAGGGVPPPGAGLRRSVWVWRVICRGVDARGSL